jgi:hypothetical protein
VQPLDAALVVLESRTVLPVRPIVKTSGNAIDWDAASRKVSIVCRTAMLQPWIGKNLAVVDGIHRQLDCVYPKTVPPMVRWRRCSQQHDLCTSDASCDAPLPVESGSWKQDLATIRWPGSVLAWR